ncbi:homeodomain-interacting protein kinase 4 [Rhinophrynus dorsalis]
MALLHSKTCNYEILEVLGRGTFGVVMKSRKRDTNELVAIKILQKDHVRNYIIENELKLLKTMRDVDKERFFIIHFHEYFEDESKHCLVFELLQQSLFEYHKSTNFSPIPVRHIRTIATQILVALSKLNELSIIHADLKPENIMLVDQAKYPFRIKVIDFGSAITFSRVRDMKVPYIQSRFYRAPEILLGLPFWENVDMWSLGCIIAELHLGFPLYPGNNEYDQIRYICETQGLPKVQMLNVASKSRNFFKVKRDAATGTRWRLKSVEEAQIETKWKPMETRMHILKSLDQLELMNSCRGLYRDVEVQAQCYDLKNMVDLVKKMLTWTSYERISQTAAMDHPFISLIELKMNYGHTRYFEMTLLSLQDSINEEQHSERPPNPAAARGQDDASGIPSSFVPYTQESKAEDDQVLSKKSCTAPTEQAGKRVDLPIAPLQLLSVIWELFKRMGVDIVGHLARRSPTGKRFIVTMVDFATWYPQEIALTNITAETVSNALISIFTWVEFPQEILMDQGA